MQTLYNKNTYAPYIIPEWKTYTVQEKYPTPYITMIINDWMLDTEWMLIESIKFS